MTWVGSEARLDRNQPVRAAPLPCRSRGGPKRCRRCWRPSCSTRPPTERPMQPRRRSARLCRSPHLWPAPRQPPEVGNSKAEGVPCCAFFPYARMCAHSVSFRPLRPGNSVAKARRQNTNVLPANSATPAFDVDQTGVASTHVFRKLPTCCRGLDQTCWARSVTFGVASTGAELHLTNMGRHRQCWANSTIVEVGSTQFWGSSNDRIWVGFDTGGNAGFLPCICRLPLRFRNPCNPACCERAGARLRNPRRWSQLPFPSRPKDQHKLGAMTEVVALTRLALRPKLPEVRTNPIPRRVPSGARAAPPEQR